MRNRRSLIKSKEKHSTNRITVSTLYDDVNENVERLMKELGHSSDLVVRVIESPHQKTLRAAVIHLDGLADDSIINENIVDPLIQWLKENDQVLTSTEIEEQISHIFTVSQLTVIENWQEFVSAVLTGDTAVLLNGSPKAFIASTKKMQSRAITEPSSQTVIRGPKDSFTENLRTNTSLIRARIQNPNVRLESMKVGKVTQTDVGIMYIRGIADESILQEVKERLKGIDIDGVLESNYIEEFIQDDGMTIFPLLLNTERPDAVVGNLLEGRIAIIIQGTPFVLIAPAVSIVGALILGQAAVEAGFVSAAVVIIVAVSAISSFTLPNTSIVNVTRGFRFIFIMISAFIGLYGILLTTLCIWLHMSSLRSFGVPYFAPFAPFRLKEQKDGFFRFPLPSLLKKSSNK
ncbi:spore germination protein [Peribacillus butanolivorans]|uniref:spore germination protein n=1 Tax=Peribacillus butanolivorans TaxID=421767 RepID=UPI002E22800E|nr:spore germination protein [Peribacillus butanolivorans]